MERSEFPLVTLSACVIGHGLDIAHAPTIEAVPKHLASASSSSAKESASTSPVPYGPNATRLHRGNPPLTPAQGGERTSDQDFSLIRLNEILIASSQRLRRCRVSLSVFELIKALEDFIQVIQKHSSEGYWLLFDVNSSLTHCVISLHPLREASLIEMRRSIRLSIGRQIYSSSEPPRVNLQIHHPMTNRLIQAVLKSQDYSLSRLDDQQAITITDAPLIHTDDDSAEFPFRLPLHLPRYQGHSLPHHLSSCFSATLSFLKAWEQIDSRQQTAIFIGNVERARSSQIARLLRSAGVAVRAASPLGGAQRLPGHFPIAICDLAGTNLLDWPSVMLAGQTISSSIWVISSHSEGDQKQIAVLMRTLPSHVRVFQITQQEEEALAATVSRLARDIREKTQSSALELLSVDRPQSLSPDERLAALQHVGGLIFAVGQSNSAAIKREIHQMTGWLSLVPEEVVPSRLKHQLMMTARSRMPSPQTLESLIHLACHWASERLITA